MEPAIGKKNPGHDVGDRANDLAEPGRMAPQTIEKALITYGHAEASLLLEHYKNIWDHIPIA